MTAALDALLNTYRLRRGMASLRRLVRRQRRLERKLARLQGIETQEKACRTLIDALLVKVGLQSGEGVTCLGYDVVHWERRGQSRINGDKLRGAGVSEIDILFATDTGGPQHFATVRPMKGS